MTSRSLCSVSSVAVMCFGLVMLQPAVASAQPAQPTAEEHDKARALLADGRSKRASGDHAGALVSFQEAHKIEKLSTTGFEVARALIDLRRLVEARELLSDIAKAPATPGEPPPITAARTDAIRLADGLQKKIPTLAVKLEGTVDAGVTATIDGVPVAVGLLGQAKPLDPGEHVLIIRKGRGMETFTVTVAELETREVTMKVPRDPDQDATKPPGFDPTKRPIDEHPPPPPPRRSYTIAWIAGVVAVIGIGVGSTTGGMAASRTPGLKERCRPDNLCPPEASKDLQTADNLALSSTISFAVAAAATGIVIWDLVRTPSPTKTSLRIGPTTLSVVTTF